MATNGTSNGNASATEPLLYHIKLTIIDLAEDKSGATRNTDILGIYTGLATAKPAALSALASEGYLESDFESATVKKADEEWTHSSGVIVFAKAPTGQEFEVGIDTRPNIAGLNGNAKSEVSQGVLPYVLQTTINYNSDGTGDVQNTEVEGTYPTRKAGFEAAKNVLLDDEVTKKSFAEYDEKYNEKGE